MKHKRPKTYLKLGILLFGISLLFYACQKDETIIEEQNDISLYGFHFSTLKSLKELTKVKNSAMRLVGNNDNKFGRSSNSEYHFSIDTMVVQTLASDNYTSYTFIAQLNEPDTTALHNYVLTFFDNDSIHEMLVKYPRIFNNPDQNYDMDNISAQPIDGNLSLFGRSICDGYPVTSWDPNANCVDYNCGLSGDHSPGQACEDGVYRAFRHCVGAWVTDCVPPPSDNDGNPDDGSGGGGGGSGNDDAIDIIPLDECIAGINEVDDNGNCFAIDEENDCEQLNGLKEKSGFTTKMTVLKNNLTGTREKGFSVRDIEGDEFSNIVTGDENGNVDVIHGETQTNEQIYRTIGIGHNHLQNNPDHIGIFTPEDLGPLLLTGLIETSAQNPYAKATPEKAFVFVLTNKGYFQMKINDKQKLQDFVLDYKTWSKDDIKEYLADIFQNPDVYNIRPTSTREEIITGFLRFMQDKDLGVDLYEGDSNTFDNVKKLTLVDNGNGSFSFDAEPCED
jgi:hypothetical protein